MTTLSILINFHLSLVLFMTYKKLKESSWRQVESMLQCFNSKKEEEEEEYYYIHSGVRRRVWASWHCSQRKWILSGIVTPSSERSFSCQKSFCWLILVLLLPLYTAAAAAALPSEASMSSSSKNSSPILSPTLWESLMMVGVILMKVRSQFSCR